MLRAWNESTAKKQMKTVVALVMLMLVAAAVVKLASTRSESSLSGHRSMSKKVMVESKKKTTVIKDALDISQYSWHKTTQTSCKSVCSGKNLEAVNTGINRNSKGLYYVCRAKSVRGGVVAGMNEIGHYAGKYCNIGPGATARADYECLCQPKGAISMWVSNEGVFTSCQTTCMRDGLDAVSTGPFLGTVANPSMFICSVCWQGGGWGCRSGHNVMALGVAETCSVAWGNAAMSEIMNCLCVNPHKPTCQV